MGLVPAAWMGHRLSAPLTFQPQASVRSRIVSSRDRSRPHARSASSKRTARRSPRRCRWATQRPWRLHGLPVKSTLRATRREKRSKPSMPTRSPEIRKPPSRHKSCLSLRVRNLNLIPRLSDNTVNHQHSEPPQKPPNFFQRSAEIRRTRPTQTSGWSVLPGAWWQEEACRCTDNPTMATLSRAEALRARPSRASASTFRPTRTRI